jgi:hypothetical protein
MLHKQLTLRLGLSVEETKLVGDELKDSFADEEGVFDANSLGEADCTGLLEVEICGKGDGLPVKEVARVVEGLTESENSTVGVTGELAESEIIVVSESLSEIDKDSEAEGLVKTNAELVTDELCVSVAVKISEELEVPESEGDANREGEGLTVRE